MKKLLCLLIALPAIALSQTNFIQNGNLDVWLTGIEPLDWGVEGNVRLNLDESTNGGVSALFIDGATAPKLIATNYTLEAGKTYQLSFDYKVKTANTTFGQQVISYSYGGVDFTPNTNSNRIPQGFDWESVSTEITPTVTELWRLEISLNSFIADAFEVYIDNVRIIDVNEPTQRDALIALYNATDGPNWTNTWDLNTDMSTWYGISLDDSGNVLAINLINNNLIGTVPAEIGNLPALFFLQITDNQLSGTIPTEIGNLTNLESLNLSGNLLSGPLPPELFSITKLEALLIAGNQLESTIPVDIGNLTNLTILDLSNNSMPGEIPTTISNLTNLNSLNLSYNSLDGGILSEIGSLVNLEYLTLNNNQFFGDIPVEVGNLTKLIELNLNNNKLFLSIPNTIENLTSLKTFNVSNNTLSGTIPTGIKNISSLESFNISTNSFVFENFEDDFSALNSIAAFEYIPQYAIDDEENIELIPGSTITLTVSETQSPNNQYQWVKNLTDNITGETNNTLILSNLSGADVGTYTCSITNPNVPGLTIYKALTSIIEVPQAEKDALIVLYNATGGPNWINTWDLNSSVDSWYGVRLNNSGNIESIELNNNGLEGVIPSEIGNLTSLKRLDLSNNQLSGGITSEIGNFTKLEFLNLGQNQLTGQIPSSIGNLTNLQELYLYNNQLTDSIPVEIGNLTSLDLLILRENQLSGEIPTEIGNLITLRSLNLRNNQLSGNIPVSIGNLTNLQTIYLGTNQLSGTIPIGIGNLTSLGVLSLDNNQLSGTIPTGIKNISSLESFNISTNSFVFENFEDDFSALNSIAAFEYIPQYTIDDEENIELIPGSTITLTVSETQSPNNQYQWVKNLTDNIAGETNNTLILSNLSGADVGTYTCSITNPNVPGLTIYKALTSIIEVPQAEKDALIALYNATDGPNWTNTWDLNSSVDSWYGVRLNNSGNVESLSLSNNNLKGTIPPQIGNLTSLKTLYINSNELPGIIPQEFYNLTNLETIGLSNNQLEGEIGSNIINLNKLIDVDLSSNILTGQIPTGIYDLTNLERINLGNNQLEGLISVEIGNLPKLNYLNFSRNNLSGSIPTEIGNLTNLQFLYLYDNQLSGTIPVEIGNLTELISLSFFDNQLFGTIPTELGNLTSLQVLYLSENQLTGSIPSEIGNLTKLVALGIHDNQLEGSIPTQITNLTNLNTFDISENKFVFEDFEDDFNHYNGLTTFRYAPQANINTQQIATVVEEASYIFVVRATISPNNMYQWRKNGVNISGANNYFYNIARTNSSHVGVYDCLITNSIVTDLQIRKEPVTLNVLFTDTDNDGVSNSIDLCPGTLPGEIVNQDGCSTDQLINIDSNDIQISVTSTSCPGVANGKVDLSFVKDYIYSVSITGNSENRSFTDVNSSTGLVISNLAAGSYDLCITIPTISGYKQCFTTVIETPANLQVSTPKVDIQNKTATFEVSGSTNYIATVNFKIYEFTFNDTTTQKISVALQNGTNDIEVITDKACQGKFNKTITTDELRLHPIPATDYLNIAGLSDANVSVTVTNLAGTIALSTTVKNTDSGYRLPLSNLATGMYLITITTPTQTINTKIFKQ